MSLDKTYKSVNGESSASIPSAPNKFPKGSLVGGGLGKSGGEASSKAGEGVSAPSFPSGRNKLSKGTEYSRNDLPDSIADKFSGIPNFPKVKEFSKSKLTGKDNGPDTFPAIKKFSKDALSKSPIKVGIDASKSADAIKSAMPLTTIRAPKEASEDMASKSQFMNGLKTMSFPKGLNKLSKGADSIEEGEPKSGILGKVAGASFLQKQKNNPTPKSSGEEVTPNSFLSSKKSLGDSTGRQSTNQSGY